MKTIGFADRSAPQMIRLFSPTKKMSPSERYATALKELKHTGNIIIYLVRGRRIRKIAVHPF